MTRDKARLGITTHFKHHSATHHRSRWQGGPSPARSPGFSRWIAAGWLSPHCSCRLGLPPSANCLPCFLVGRSAAFRFASVPELLALGYRDFHFDFTIFAVQ